MRGLPVIGPTHPGHGTGAPGASGAVSPADAHPLSVEVRTARPAHAGSPKGGLLGIHMIKHEIQRSAEQLGRTVRQALADFSQETGMQANISIEWITAQSLNETRPEQFVGRIRVEVAGMSVEA